MDAVKSFNAELSSLYEVKPPISKAKMTALTRGAIKGIKFYKHVVQSVEKFILKCKPEYKVPGLYVIDSIVRQSRHQFGADKDVFAPRFAKNMQQTFMNLFKCPAEDKSKIIRVLNLWQKNQVFAPEVVQPLFDLADPNHPIHKEIQSAAAHQAQLAAAAAAAAAAQAQQAQSNGAQQVVAQVAQVLLAGKGSPAIQKTPTKMLQMQQIAAQDQTSNNTFNQSTNMDANTLAQLQQLHRLLLRQQGDDKTQDAGAGNMVGGGVHFDKKLLDFDYGSDEDDDGGGHGNGPSPKVVAGIQQQMGASGGGMDVGNLLTNPEVLRQLTTLQQSLTQPGMHEDMEKMRKLQQMKQQEDEFDKHLAQTVPNLPFAAECEFKPNQMSSSDLSQLNMNSYYITGNDLMQMNQLPPGFNTQQQLQLQQQMDDGMNDQEVEFVGTGDNIIEPFFDPFSFEFTKLVNHFKPIFLPKIYPQKSIYAEAQYVEDSDSNDEVIDQDSPAPVQASSPSNNRRSPSNDKYSGRRRNRSRSRDRSSPSNRRSSRRGRSRSRSRSRDRSPRRRHRSRSKDKERTGEKDKGGKTVMTEMDRERERERAKRGLPPIKKENLSVCSTTLWVGHLSKLVHQEDISDTFGEFGEIVTIDMILPRGCAFVVMNRRQDASRCLTKLKGFKIQQKAITLAWAPGKGVKGKDLKDYWEGDLGVSYIPWSKLKPDIDIELIEDGGMIDEETAPAWLKPKLDRSASHVAAMSLMKPEGDMATMPAYLGQPPNVTSVGSVVDTSQPPPPPAGTMLPGQPMPPLPQLVSPFQLNNRLMGMNLPPGLMPNVNIGVPPPSLQNALMTNQLLSLNAAANINAAVAAVAAAQQQQQQQPPPSLTATLMSQLGNLGDIGKPPLPSSSVVDPTIPPPSSIITTMVQSKQPSLSETLLSMAQQQPPPQPFNLMHHPPPIQDSMDIEMEDVLHDGGARGNTGSQSLSYQLLSMQNAPGNQLTRPPPSFQAPPPTDNSNTFTSALSRLHAVTNHRNDNQQQYNLSNQPNNNSRRDDNSPSRIGRDKDNRDNNRDRRTNDRDNSRDSRNRGGFDSRDSNNRGRDRDRDNRDSNRRGRDNRDRDNRDNKDRDRNSSRCGGGGGYGNSRDGREDRRDRRSNDRGTDRDAGKADDWIKNVGDGVKSKRGHSGERNNRWGPNPTSQVESPAASGGGAMSNALDEKEKERRQREKALNDRLREMAGMEKQDDKTDEGLLPPRDRDDRDQRERDGPKPLMSIDRPPPLFPDGPPGQPQPLKLDQPSSSSDVNKNTADRRNSNSDNRSVRGGGGGRRPPSFRRSSSNDDDGSQGPANKRVKSKAAGPPRLLEVQDGSPGDLPPALLEVDGPPPDFPPPIMNLPPEFTEHPEMLSGGPSGSGLGIFEPPLSRNVSEFDGPPLMMRGEGREERFPPPRERFRDERGPLYRGGPAPLLDFMEDGPTGFRGGDNFPPPQHHRPGLPPHHHQQHPRDFGGGGPIDMFQDDDLGGPQPGVFEPSGGGGPSPGGFNPDFGPPPGFGSDPFGPPSEFRPPPSEFDGSFRSRGRFRGGRGGPLRGSGPRGHWMDNDGPPYRNNFARSNFPGLDGRPPNKFRDGPPSGGRGGGRFGPPPPNDFMEFDGPPGDDIKHMMYDNEQMHGGWRENRRGGRGGRDGGSGRVGGRGGLRGGRGSCFNNNQDIRNKTWRNNDNLNNRENENRFNKFNKQPEEGPMNDDIPPPKRSGTPLRDEPVVQSHSENPAPPGVPDVTECIVSDKKDTTDKGTTAEKSDDSKEVS